MAALTHAQTTEGHEEKHERQRIRPDLPAWGEERRLRSTSPGRATWHRSMTGVCPSATSPSGRAAAPTGTFTTALLAAVTRSCCARRAAAGTRPRTRSRSAWNRARRSGYQPARSTGPAPKPTRGSPNIAFITPGGDVSHEWLVPVADEVARRAVEERGQRAATESRAAQSDITEVQIARGNNPRLEVGHRLS